MNELTCKVERPFLRCRRAESSRCPGRAFWRVAHLSGGCEMNGKMEVCSVMHRSGTLIMPPLSSCVTSQVTLGIWGHLWSFGETLANGHCLRGSWLGAETSVYCFTVCTLLSPSHFNRLHLKHHNPSLGLTCLIRFIRKPFLFYLPNRNR